MATGFYGINRPADVSPDDAEVVMIYTENREAISAPTVNRLSSTTVLNQLADNDGNNVQGLYNLTLPSTQFNELGVYNIYIKPREIRLSIEDCGVLFTQPNVKGIIINLAGLSVEDRTKIEGDNSLVGYRVEYFDTTTNTKVRNLYRVITSSFYAEPVVTNVNNTQQKSIRYKYVSTPGDLIFCTLTPSTAPTNNLNAIPFIGEPGQNIVMTNTFFDPLHIEVEMVEHDADTLSYALYGDQIKSLEDGLYTIYDREGNVYKQYQLYEVRNEINEKLYEVREDLRDNIANSSTFDEITDTE